VTRSKVSYFTKGFLVCVVRVVTFIRKRSMGCSTNRINKKQKQMILSMKPSIKTVAYLGILLGWVQQFQLRTEGRENGDLGAVAL
jgi:hypothetical protein